MNVKGKNTAEYKDVSVEDTLLTLKTSAEGLSSEEAAARASRYGLNEITETKRNAFLDFVKRYWGPMPWLLEFAILITIVLQHYAESIIIFVLLSINAAIGYFQSQNSQKAVEILKMKLKIKAKVLRGGEWVLLPAKDIVPGDVITCKLGDLVPADVVVISGYVSADESALTGESLPKTMHEADIIYSSSIIKRGEAKCAVVNTGTNTFFGKTVELVKIAKPKSKQEELMLTIVRYMMYLGIAASVAVTLLAIYLHKDILFILSFVVVFLIGSIPVALPAVLTIVQAVGALDLSRKGVLVTRLDSIEDAASIDVFCFDKTGTITQNKLSVADSIAFGKYKKDDVVRFAALVSKEEGMDAIDLAVINYAKSIQTDFGGYKQISYVPFNPEDKKTEAAVEFDGMTHKIFKGSSQTILELCKETDSMTMAAVNRAIDGFSLKGSRTIAVAITEGNKTELVGILAIADPPRTDSKSMIEGIQNLGIKCLMLTGDSLAIAEEIAGQVGIGHTIVRAGELKGKSHDMQLSMIRESDGFAEVYPEDKYEIVKLLQDSGHMVGMTGDGVNDSPALKQAELGTAVSDAADVAKASASIVLTKPGLGEIIDAVKISRQTYQRMLTWVINKITKVVEIAVLLTIGFFWLHDMVISLLGMSLLVFANDFATMSIAADHVKSTDSPNKWNIKNITAASAILGLFFALEDLLIIFIGLKFFRLGLDELRTLVLLSLVFNSQFRMLIARERRHFWSSMPGRNLLLVNIATIISFGLIGIFGVFIPGLPISQVLILLGITISFMLVLDFIKFYVFKKLNV